MQNLNYISFLIKKYFQRTLNVTEILDLDIWLNENIKNQEFLNKLEHSGAFGDDLDGFNTLLQDWLTDEKESDLMTRVLVGISTQSVTRKHTKTIWYWAASIFLILSVSVMFFYLQYNVNVGQYKSVTFTEMKDVFPKTNKVQIILPDGRVIVLNENSEGIHLGDDEIYNGGLNFGEGNLTKSTKIVLEVPLKSNCTVVLSDGTKVYLNSGSKLTYPFGFDQDKRVVELEGEAFFEVAKAEISKNERRREKKLPFIVKTATQTIEVLGTKFNVSAYSDQKYTKTVLFEGKVAVAMHNSKTEKRVLQPGQQSTNDGSQFKIQTADLDQVSAWKDGLFYFDGTDSQDVLAQLGRWYGIEVEHDDNYSKIPFYGVIDRSKSLKSVLQILEKTGLTFKILSKGDHIKLLIKGE